MSESLHIVCLDAPSPPDYGGAIDMYYKIKALAETGRKIILHYFQYRPNRGTKGLENFCTEIHAYDRKPFYRSLPLSQPFIIQSRINEKLIKRLNQDNHPILLEGLHCAGIIPFINKSERVVLRMHNDEANYYKSLAASETSFLKKQYFLQESRLLKQFQSKLNKSVKLACLSETDIATFQQEYNFQAVHFVPCFIPWQRINSKVGKGDYCLYHGNMSVSENEEAALWLIKNVFHPTSFPLIIAGKGISSRLINMAASYKNVQLIDAPSITQIDELIRDAHINVLPSMNNTGVKLKLLNALLNGRHCLTNTNGVKGSRIESGVHVADDPEEWIRLVEIIKDQEFTAGQLASRKEMLFLYNNLENARRLNAIW